MKIAPDTETALIRPGLAAPPMACTSWADDELNFGLYHARDSHEPWSRWLADPETHLYGLNFAYDTAVCAAEFPDLFLPICEAYLDLRIHDVGIDQRLIDIADGCLDGRWEPNPNFDPSLPTKGRNKPRRWRKNKYALAELALRLWGEFIAKGADTWRMRYGTLIPVYPASAWPEDAQRYAIHDSVTTMKVHHWHLDNAEAVSAAHNGFAAYGYSVGQVLANSGAQAQTAFALHLQSCRGIRTDGAACGALILAAEAEIDRCRDLCAGLARGFDYGDDYVPLVEQGKRGGWTKKQEITRAYMLGAILRSAGLSDDAGHREWLADEVKAFVEGCDELPKNAHAEIVYSDGDDVTELDVKLTKGGEIALTAEACKDTNDPILRAYATYTSATGLRTKTKRMLHGASVPLQTRYKLPMATGRTSSSASDKPLIGDNFQNFRRNALANELGEVLPGQRECIIARPGFDLGSIDYNNAEMCSDGQISIWEVGYSVLADALNAGQDVHARLAAGYLMPEKISYEEMKRLLGEGDKTAENARQFGKVPNFALGGGARAKTLIPYAKGMGITLTPAKADDLYGAYHSEWTEVAIKHAGVRKRLRAGGGQYILEQYVSGRLRLIDRYTVGCNGPFQSLTADAATSVQLWLAVECYTGKEYEIGPDGWRIRPTGRCSPLEGSYPILFCHDENIFEFRQWKHQHEAAYRGRDIMVRGYNRFFPDVPISAEPCLMQRWYKGAKTVFDDKGRLKTWAPKPKDLAKLAARAA